MTRTDVLAADEQQQHASCDVNVAMLASRPHLSIHLNLQTL